MSFRHKAIYGQTGSGKTWLLKRLAKQFRKHKQKVIVYSASGDLSFAQGSKTTADADELNHWLSLPENYRAHVMLDEAAVLFEETRPKTHKHIWNLFSMGRHKGYTAYAATQYPTSIPKKVRVNCAECYCFRLGDYQSAKLVWEDYNRLMLDGRPAWEIIQNLDTCKALHFIQPETIERVALK